MTSSQHAMLRAALTGSALGAAWGVLARLWMRLISTTPEFSWVGSFLIVALATVFGASVGVVTEARRQGRSRWWLLAGLPGMLLFAGQGMAFLPGALIGSVLVRRRSAAARVVAGAALLVVPVLLWRDTRLDEDTMLSTPVAQQLWLLVGMPVLTGVLAWHGSQLWGRRRLQDGVLERDPSVVEVRDQSASADRARSSLRSDSSREVPAGPA